MGRLLIHIGYPKAASTTLQNGLFYELHKEKMINFIARAWESGYYGSAKDKKEYKAWFRYVIQEPNEDSKSRLIKDMSLKISKNKLNLLSEGLFLTNERYHMTFPIANKIHEYFKEKVDKIELLFVIRSQQTLIMSDYVQTYRRINEKTFSEYLNNRIESEKKGKFKIFYFDSLIRSYSEVVGKENINILFFEDLINDRKKFSDELGTILGVHNEIIDKLLETAYFNKTPKVERGSVVRKIGHVPFGERVMRRIAGRFGFFKERLDHSTRQIYIPDITDDEKLLIFNTFRDGNFRLAEDFDLDKDRMKKYGYF